MRCPYTGKLEDVAQFDVENIWLKALRNDAARVLDKAVADEFKTAPVCYIPTGTDTSPAATWDTDGTPSTAATRHIQAFDVKEIADAMKATYLMPKVDGENYIAIVSVKFGRKLKDDPDFEDALKYGDPDRLFSGEIGRYYGVRFIEETNALAQTLGTTSYNGEAIFLGDDAMVEGVVVMLEVRAKIPTDYGRDKGLAWYYMGGWEITFSTANPGEARIIRVTSS
jgi:N4-gp56 family major capsid protein